MQVAAGKPCPLCENPLERRALAAVSGDESPLRLTLRGMPVLRCVNGHTYFSKHALPIWLLRRLVDEDVDALPAGEPQGLLFRKYRCACGERLATRQERVHSFRIDMSYAEEPAFAVELAMPVFKCAACGKEQVRSREEVRKVAPAALVHAFKAAGIKAPG